MLLFIGIGCHEAGTTIPKLNGNEENLPPELKGLKVYSVYIDNDVSINVAVLNNNLNSLNYYENKINKSVIILENNNSNSRIVHYSEIISETDEYILIKK